MLVVSSISEGTESMILLGSKFTHFERGDKYLMRNEILDGMGRGRGVGDVTDIITHHSSPHIWIET